ncbi:MAG: TRAP transporter small permease [Sphaerochaetaceae bacterium]|nr:TRAP transporter small permease [Sphaerochaetaceae bacterium]
MLKTLEKIKDIYTKVTVGICAVICTVILGVDVLQVIFRYLTNTAFVFAEDVSVFGMIWIMCIGISIGTLNHEHLLINIIDGMLDEKGLKVLNFLIDIVLIACGLFMVYVGSLSANINKGFTQSMLGIDEFYRYLPVIVGGVLTFFAAIECVIEQILRWTSKEVQ